MREWHLFYIIDHMGTVGVLELDVLLCVARHDGQAYGLLVRAEVSEARAHDYSVGAIYTTLARLERKGRRPDVRRSRSRCAAAGPGGSTH